ncbi:protein-disulfide reductase DsbD [Nitrococcus mobilis]|uniref:Thiol:disulfide interchange protein DsbD n=1 Tax=Nitrococcus mobilis Nb-231 TaxID=314278 RepID=A4BP19_9GAMM|nr:protein-disulfide reductase DsbD [Nitrococcus mobilis]EAR22320.1 thiol:disulfide interchange protein, DsbD family [Nitrococcus mobilis Nb-231]
MRLRLIARLVSLLVLLSIACAISAAPSGVLAGLFGSDEPVLLPVEQAFPISAELVAPDRLVARWDVQPGYYLYRDKLAFELADTGNSIRRAQTPAGEPKEDPYFGRLEVYHHPVEVTLQLEHAARRPFELVAHYQGCADAGLCYPPQTTRLRLVPASAGLGVDVDTTRDASAADVDLLSAGTNQLAQILQEGRPLAILATFFVAGLLLAFTACLYPMIPILSGLIAGDRHRRKGSRAFLLSLVYVESTALAYAIAGVIAGLTGQAVQADLQSPWFLGAFAAVFIALALSMFGLYELQLPSRWQTRLFEASRHQRGGTVVGVAAMGALSVLIVGACSGPALVAALVFISSTGEAWLGGLALFVLANGMGVPLLLIGTAAGKWLPQAGHWMETVRRVFGVLFLAVALWMLERVLPAELGLALWGALLLGCGVYLGGLDRLTGAAGGMQRLCKTGGLLLLIWGSAALIGAASGGGDLRQPLRALVAVPPTSVSVSSTHGFRQVNSVQELDAALQRASVAGQPVVLDVYADWCVYCVELDERTFSDPRVQQLLSRAVRLRADVTAMSPAHKTLLRRLDVFLPPAVMFFGSDGHERRGLRVVGFLEPAAFLQRAQLGLFGGAS